MRTQTLTGHHKVLAGEPVDPKRSALMARVKVKHSKPEMAVRRIAHRLGYRFRLHRDELPERRIWSFRD